MPSVTTCALLGWFPVTLIAFAFLHSRRALLFAFIGGWLLLPIATINIPGLPGLDKVAAISVSAIGGVVIFDSRRLLSLRPSMLDLPVVVWCACPFATSLSNGLGPYDGLSASYSALLAWGVPYIVGRMYFTDRESLCELAKAVFLGGLVYVPLCLFEIRFSPQLHKLVYGFQQQAFGQTKRFGGYRPAVFMQHGLMVGFWMSAASIIGLALWGSRCIRTIGGVSMAFWVPLLVVVAVLCKSTGAIVLLVAGAIVFALCRRKRSVGPLLVLILAAPLYIVARLSGAWSGESVISLIGSVSQERAGSLAFRIETENLVANRAWQRPIFGWGGWSRSHVFNEYGKDLTIIDGLWIIAFGQRGLVGLVSLTTSLLLPTAIWVVRPSAAIALPGDAGAEALAIVLPLYMLDALANAMINPIYMIAGGGLISLYGVKRRFWVAQVRQYDARSRRAGVSKLGSELPCKQLPIA